MSRRKYVKVRVQQKKTPESTYVNPERPKLIKDEGGFLGSGVRWLPGAPLW
jgi:hypothetical protein